MHQKLHMKIRSRSRHRGLLGVKGAGGKCDLWEKIDLLEPIAAAPSRLDSQKNFLVSIVGAGSSLKGGVDTYELHSQPILSIRGEGSICTQKDSGRLANQLSTGGLGTVWEDDSI